MAREVEATLVVVHGEPLRIMEEISALRALGPYRLSPGGLLSLRDSYYDTPSGLLSTRGIAVRIREQEGLPVFCIKQDEQVDEEGTAVREEIEMPWSRQCMDHVAHILHKLSGGINEVPPKTDSPGECLACLGLIPVQERETTRLLLNVSRTDGQYTGTVAVLALDRVCYDLGVARILHHEVEVEAALADVTAPVKEIAVLLSRRFEDALRPWRHNKLVTGFALERLIAEYRLHLRSGRYFHLSGADYEAIVSVLKDG